MRKVMSTALALGLTGWCAGGQAPKPAPDSWLGNVGSFPAGFSTSWVRSNLFANLRAEVVLGNLKICWPAERTASNDTVIVHVSFDEPGHWPARDWRSQALTLRGQTWETSVGVTDVDLPIIYFVSAKAGDATQLSPMRVCHPRVAGLEDPTRVFWPFLEGFEDGVESWQLLTPEAPILETDPDARTGRFALVVRIPAGKRSVTVATTRLRGWHVWKQNATGARTWLRARAGEGRVRFTLLAHAQTTNQAISLFPQETQLTAQWQKVDLPFANFPKLPLASVDQMTLEFIGEGPCEFLVDDLQLLGPWRTELE